MLLIIPAFNEEENIEKVINNIIENYPQYDYVIINDCSWDNTENICIRNGYNYISLPIQMGIGGAVQTGYKYAYKNGYDIAVQIDGDGQHDPMYIAQGVSVIIDKTADIVIGSRYIKHEGFQSTAARRFGIGIISFVIKILTGKTVKDPTSGYRIANKNFIKIYAGDYSFDYPEPESIITAIMNGGKVKEIPVIMKERQGGKSSISGLYNSAYYMIKVVLDMIICRISYGVRR